MMMWFRADAISSRQVLYEQGWSDKGINIYIDTGALLVGAWDVSNNESDWNGQWLVSTNIQAGSWHHIAFTLYPVGAATGFRTYLDGDLVRLIYYY